MPPDTPLPAIAAPTPALPPTNHPAGPQHAPQAAFVAQDGVRPGAVTPMIVRTVPALAPPDIGIKAAGPAAHPLPDSGIALATPAAAPAETALRAVSPPNLAQPAAPSMTMLPAEPAPDGDKTPVRVSVPSAPVTPTGAAAAAQPAVAAPPPPATGMVPADRRSRLPPLDDAEGWAPVTPALGDTGPRLLPARDTGPAIVSPREAAASTPSTERSMVDMAIATERFGDVRVAVEGTATDVKVSLALAPTAVLATADAQRLTNGLAADLAATGVRLQSLDISGGDTARGGNPQGQREPTPQRTPPAPFALPRSAQPTRSDRYA